MEEKQVATLLFTTSLHSLRRTIADLVLRQGFGVSSVERSGTGADFCLVNKIGWSCRESGLAGGARGESSGFRNERIFYGTCGDFEMVEMVEMVAGLVYPRASLWYAATGRAMSRRLALRFCSGGAATLAHLLALKERNPSSKGWGGCICGGRTRGWWKNPQIVSGAWDSSPSTLKVSWFAQNLAPKHLGWVPYGSE